MPADKTILRAPSLLKPIIVREICRMGGQAHVGQSTKEGPDRIIYDIVAAELGVTEKERKILIDGEHRSDKGRNMWDYTMLVAVQQLKDREKHMLKGTQRGVWELTQSGMEFGRQLLGLSNDPPSDAG
ncbi:hypothetical protein V5E97_06345 [Singulisphaera sp. Ch08]|uniref:Restriction system protein Mrr-like N-terminal domain-containing protein n=1 Tax=Singulisphaera sp. Ch08 TaxID=3120278 RepID=A0AAU7CKV0_9BACT